MEKAKQRKGGNKIEIHITKRKKEVPFNLSVAYKAQLKAYSKRQFDPFKRHERIEIPCSKSPDGVLVTTIGQMNFFKFAIENKLIEWLEEKNNLMKVENQINSDLKSNNKTKQKHVASTSNYKITVTFK